MVVIVELLVVSARTDDDTEALAASGLAGTPHSPTQLRFLRFVVLFTHCATLLLVVLLEIVAPRVAVQTLFAVAFLELWAAASVDTAQYVAALSQLASTYATRRQSRHSTRTAVARAAHS